MVNYELKKRVFGEDLLKWLLERSFGGTWVGIHYIFLFYWFDKQMQSVFNVLVVGGFF